MMQRVKQFYRALTARLTPADKKWVAESLPPAARPLFYAMHPADQYHALKVAQTAMQLWADNPAGDKDMLLRAALLHDVGRVQGDMGIAGKVAAVLVQHFFPSGAEKLAKSRKGWLGHVMYVYYHHPEIGAVKVETLGFKQEAALIRCHHAKPKADDPPELVLLRRADELN